MPLDVPVLTVADAAAWRQWLAREAETSKGVWLTLAKKGATEPTSLTNAQALDEALCYGWINGQGRAGDEKTCLSRYTPRTAKSMWSKINVGHIARLENEGRMQPRGRLEVEKAKLDGRWDAAYGGQSNIETPDYLSAAIAEVPEAQAQWDILSNQNRFAIIFRLINLKTEAGRQKRVQEFVDMLARGETLHPQKQQQQQRRETVKGTTSTAKVKLRVTKPSRSESPLRRSGRLRTS